MLWSFQRTEYRTPIFQTINVSSVRFCPFTTLCTAFFTAISTFETIEDTFRRTWLVCSLNTVSVGYLLLDSSLVSPGKWVHGVPATGAGSASSSQTHA